MTTARLEYIHDIHFLKLLVNGIRGGLQIINTRYAEANLPDLPGYKEDEPRTCLEFWDFVSLYSYCLKQPIPVGNFKILTDEQISR